MAFEQYVRSGARLLRCGYTTGTCAALAAKGAARLLLTGECPAALSLTTPGGIPVTAPLAERRMDGDAAVCAVQKDGGDDADATDGLLVRAAVRRCAGTGVQIDGGEGVGRVTKPGLDQPPGAAAINRVPRQMIAQEVGGVCRELGYEGGLSVVVSIPGGAKCARRTFNPLLGIEGGLSVLGTSGIVEPMSEQALVATIAVQQRQAAALGARGLILTPGNYGADFLRREGLDRLGIPVVKCSNFIGDALDIAVTERFTEVLLVGHAGKLVKLAGGIMNTHSRQADCRMELLCAHAAVCGADTRLCRALMEAATTDAAFALLGEAHLREAVLQSLLEAIQRQLERRTNGALRAGAVLFSNEYGLLGQTDGAKEILEGWK